jgi:hypothetical protein
MARFRGIVQGNRERVSRLGSVKSGIDTIANGWEFGVRVWGRVNSAGEDEFTIDLTSGSSAAGLSKRIGTFTITDLKK